MRAGLRAAALAVAAMAWGAHAAGVKTVKDWTAVCDNVGTCTAFGFSPEVETTQSYVRIARDAGGAALPSVTIVYDAADAEPDQRWTLDLDGAPIPGLGPIAAKGSDSGAVARLRGESAAALITALRNGEALSLTTDAKALGRISLAGSAAVLLWVDDQQGRVGTVTALARKGPKPIAAVPGPRLVPVIVGAPAVSQAGLPDHAPGGLIKDIDDCDVEPGQPSEDIVLRLAPGVVLWGPECAMAAYSELTVFFVGDEHGGHLRRVAFPEAPYSDQAKDDVLVNADVDAKALTISQFAKGRGLGDCGESATWVWDGKSFDLVLESVMPECRGVTPDGWPHLFIGRRK